jgi:hypothetical protein
LAQITIDNGFAKINGTSIASSLYHGQVVHVEEEHMI